MKISEERRAPGRGGRGLSDADLLYKILFEQSPFGVLIIDTQGKILDFNEAAHRQLGYTRQEFSRLTIPDLDPVQSPGEIESSMEEVLKKGTAEFEVKHRAKNGEIRDVQVITKVIDLSGKTVFQTIWRDITSRRRQDEALRLSEAKFHALFDSANDAIFILDLDGNFIDINPSAYERLGYAKEEILRMHVSRLHSPRYAGLVAGRLAELRERGRLVVESEHMRKDGTIMPVEINARIIEYGGGKAIFSIVRDTTERKKAEEKRIESEKRYHALFDNMPMGVVAVDLNRRIVDCNRAFETMIGYSAEELKTLSIPDISHEGDDLATRENYRAMLEGKINSFTMEKRHIRKDGGVIWTNMTGTLIRGADREPQILFGILEDISERKKAEESLLLFRNMLNQSKDAIFVNEPATGRFLIVNDKACSSLGYSREELLTKRTLDIESGFSDQAAWDAHVREVRSRGNLILEGIHRHHDGTLFPVEVNVTYTTLGGTDYMVAVARDISERKLAEQALRRSEERLSKAQKIAHVGNWEWNIATNQLYWSDEVYRIYGVDPADFTPTFDAVSKAMHPDDLAPFLNAVHAAIYEMQPFEMDYRLIRPDGAERTVHTIGEVTYDRDGKPLLKSGTVQDVTEIKKTEEALRGSRDFIENILNTVDEAFIVIDREYRIVRANSAFGVQAGAPVEEVIGKHCYEVSHQRARPCDEAGNGIPEECAVRRCFDTGEPHSCVHKHHAKDGSVLYVEAKSFPLKDASGNVTSAIEVINNITDKHLLEEQMLRTQKLEAVGLLAGGIAHDFNNLLQGVFGNISLAKMFSDKQGKAYAMLEGAEAALYQATSLTKQLLTFSKGGEPVKKVLSLAPVIDTAARFVLSGSNVDCTTSFAEDLKPVEADEGQLTQVVHNIVLNASEAMPDGGTVRIDVRNVSVGEKSSLPLRKGDYVRITIADSGSGIPDFHLPRIFDPYFTTKKKGSGLGLATSYSIVKKHGGALTVTSELGAGTTFVIHLPASVGSLPSRQAETQEPVNGKGKILIMDDEEIVRAVAGRMISSLGYEVDFAGKGEEALEKYSSAMKSGAPFDVVILDLTIRGGMGGQEAVKALARLDPGIRAVVSSGYSDDDVLSRYSDHGFRAVLNKPYDIRELSSVLHSLLNERK